MANNPVIDVSHVAQLANLTLSPDEVTKFASQFSDTLKIVDHMSELDTSAVAPSFQVTGLSNITREDVIDQDRILTQTQALSGAHQTHNGYFVVPSIFENE